MRLTGAPRGERKVTTMPPTMSTPLLLLLLLAALAPAPAVGGISDYFGGGGNSKNSPEEDLQRPANQAHRRLDDHGPGSSPARDELQDGDEPPHYGVDISFPIHHMRVSENYPWLPHNVDPTTTETPAQFQNEPVQPLGEKNKWYDDLIKGCRDHYGAQRGRLCDSTERDRVAMNLRQPQSMQNYTDLGFKKIKAPKEVFEVIKKFWDANKDIRKEERWNAGNTYVNHWDAKSWMISVEDTSLRGGGSKIKKQIWDAARSSIEEWTGESLTECSLYGVRVYEGGAVLAPHVDRLPLVSSAIINVAQDVDEPWPLEVYGHDGRAHNVTMEPGDMVLYESHSVVHGRPFPLVGRYFANVFIHFEPVGHSTRHDAAQAAEAAGGDVDEKYRKDAEKGIGGHEGSATDGLPPYIIAGSPEETNWRRSHQGGWKKPKDTSFETGSTEAHTAAQKGDVDQLKKIAEKKKTDLHREDANGWQPIHEGARGGHVEVVELLVKHGADVNKRTNSGIGGTPLWLAKQSHGKKHPVTQFLEGLGALDVGPEL